MHLTWTGVHASTPSSRRHTTQNALHRPRAAMKPAIEQAAVTLRTLPSSYKGVLLDQFGVLHDGRVAYPGAVEAVEYLHSQGMQLLIISNSSRRTTEALGNIAKLGFNPSHFAGVITSGEVTHRQLQQRPSAFWQGLGRRCLHLTWAGRGAISLDGLDLEVTQDPDATEFILAHGTEALGAPTPAHGAHTAASSSDGSGTAAAVGGSSNGGGSAMPCSLEEMRRLMQRCAELQRHSGRSVPMIVANPDVVTVHGSELRTMPGTLARWYREMGGEVHLMGKPAPIIYKEALAMLGLLGAQVVAIGDSLEHDIAGAQGAGIDSLLIAGGIHAKELLGADGLSISDAGLEQLCNQFGAAPTHVLPWFRLS